MIKLQKVIQKVWTASFLADFIRTTHIKKEIS